MSLKRFIGAVGAAITIASALSTAHAEVSEVRISKGFGILYLPLIVMQDQKFLEKRAKAAGLGDVKVNWVTLDGGNVVNDAMMAGTLDFAGIGTPAFLTLWAKAKGIPGVEVIGVTGMSANPLWLMSNKPELKSLKDFTAQDKIAVPGIKTSAVAVVLQMIAAKEFGMDNYAKMDPMTVSLPHPEAVATLIAGKTEINAHFSSPPFQYVEAKAPGIHRVLSSVDYLGTITSGVTFAPRKFVDANPKMTQAFIDAMDDANALIANDKKHAAAIFARSSKVKVDPTEIQEMIEDKDARFATTPEGMMQFAEFLYKVGSIKVKPSKWSDLYVPQLADRSGS